MFKRIDGLTNVDADKLTGIDCSFNNTSITTLNTTDLTINKNQMDFSSFQKIQTSNGLNVSVYESENYFTDLSFMNTNKAISNNIATQFNSLQNLTHGYIYAYNYRAYVVSGYIDIPDVVGGDYDFALSYGETGYVWIDKVTDNFGGLGCITTSNYKLKTDELNNHVSTTINLSADYFYNIVIILVDSTANFVDFQFSYKKSTDTNYIYDINYPRGQFFYTTLNKNRQIDTLHLNTSLHLLGQMYNYPIFSKSLLDITTAGAGLTIGTGNSMSYYNIILYENIGIQGKIGVYNYGLITDAINYKGGYIAPVQGVYSFSITIRCTTGSTLIQFYPVIGTYNTSTDTYAISAPWGTSYIVADDAGNRRSDSVTIIYKLEKGQMFSYISNNLPSLLLCDFNVHYLGLY